MSVLRSCGPFPPSLWPWMHYSILDTIKKWKSKLQWSITSIPVRMVIIKWSTNNKHWRGCGEKGTLLHCWREYKLIQPLGRIVWRFLNKLNIELPYDLILLLLVIYLEQNIIQNMHPSVHCTTIYNSQVMEVT